MLYYNQNVREKPPENQEDMKMINNYAILAKKSNENGCYFVDGFKTLPTMRKKYNKMIAAMQGKPHNKIMLVARDYEDNIIKIYEKEE